MNIVIPNKIKYLSPNTTRLTNKLNKLKKIKIQVDSSINTLKNEIETINRQSFIKQEIKALKRIKESNIPAHKVYKNSKYYRCPNCTKYFKINDRYKMKNTYSCKECHKSNRKVYYLENKEKEKASVKQWKSKNKKKQSGYSMKWAKKVKGHISAALGPIEINQPGIKNS